MSNRKSNMHKVLEKNFLNHLIKAKERVVLEFILGNRNQAPKYNQTLFHAFVVVVLYGWIILWVFFFSFIF